MITNWHQYFHWLYYQPAMRHYFNLGTGLFMWLFLAITMPFGIYANNFSSFLVLVVHLSSFGLCWILITYSMDFVGSRVLQPRPQEDAQRDWWLWLLKLVLLVHLFALLRASQCNWQCIDLYEYGELWVACFLIFLLAYVPFTLYGKYKYFQAMAQPAAGTADGLFILQGSGKETIRVDLRRVVYIQSDDNYVDILSLPPAEGSSLVKQTLRATLKSMTEQLQSHPQFRRIHRSYIANLQLAESLKGGKVLVLAVPPEAIELPVSKKHSRSLTEWFAATTTRPKND